MIARVEREAVGFAFWFHNYSTFLAKPGLYLEDLFVLPDWRGRGIGAALLRHLARIALERDCGRMEWSVLDWNEPAIGFYRSIGAKPMDEWTVYRLTGDDLRSSPRSGRRMRTAVDLREPFDRLYRSFDHLHSASDPVHIVRRYSAPDDREVVGFCAAGLAFGRVASVLHSIESLLAVMGPRPAAFVRDFDPATHGGGSRRSCIDGFAAGI